MPSRVITVDEASFEVEVLRSSRPVLVGFSIALSAPCRILQPTLEKFSAENQNIKVVRIDISRNRKLGREFDIRSVPTLMVFRDGKPLRTAIGTLPQNALEALVRQALEMPQAPKPAVPASKKPAFQGPRM